MTFTLSAKLSERIAQYRSDAAAAARAAQANTGEASLACLAMADVLETVADQLEKLLPESDPEGEAALRRLFRGWNEPELKRKYAIRQLRNTRIRFNRRRGAA